jgi:S-DNA-T family DNA segregation ATPase FtsK/SpoIIIE
LTDTLVSRQHAKIYVADVIEVVDNGSANGTLSEGVPIDHLVMHPGDTVVVGDTVFTITLLNRTGAGSSTGTIFFNRPPVLSPHFEGVTLEAPVPPEPAPRSRFPVLSMMMPLVLGLVLYLATKSVMDLLFIGLSPLMMVGNLVEGQFTGKKSAKKAREAFAAAMVAFERDAAASLAAERLARCAASPPVKECMHAAQDFQPLLWSRPTVHEEFLALRIGSGTLASLLSIKLPTQAKNNQEYWDELIARTSVFSSVDDVPVTCVLPSAGHLGIGGVRTDVLGLARSLIVQACVLTPPDSLALAICIARTNKKEWDWVKWLPHVKSSSSSLLVESLCASQMSCDLLTEDLERIVAERMASHSAKSTKTAEPSREAILVVIADEAPINRPRLVAMAEECAQVGIYFLWLASSVEQLPAICTAFVDLERGASEGTVGFVHDGTRQRVLVEEVTSEEALQCALRLSPVVDAGASSSQVSGLPQAVSFLRLVGLEVAEDPGLVVERWLESRSIVRGPNAIPQEERRPGTLRALLGESTSGPYVLDLRTNGPHALVGGTTGSGKSELLQSWILGMAVAHSPQRVTFLLVDYKGGSAFRECVHLPHTVGLVTDLTPYLVRRALVSFGAELRYREDLLHRRNAKDLVELERKGDPDAPPSLVVVVDEFAALVQEVPEFVDGMVNIAQRGRSLGLHLILATQRPAGVIKENLRANTNLRLALRMADVADSSDVLGVADAAYFDPDVPGRAGVRSGPSRLHLFQAAYSGGFTSKEPEPPVFHISNLDFDGGPNWERPMVQAKESIKRGASDIQRIVQTVQAASSAAAIEPPRKPWLSPLAPSYKLENFDTVRRDDEIVFAVADAPADQRQVPIAFYPDRDGNLAVVGTGGSGKSTLLRTLAIAAGITLRGGPIQVYALDFGARGLQMLDTLPHVGSVIPGSDTERVGRLLDWCRALIDERALRYSAVDAGTIADYRRITDAPNEARIFLLLDGMSAFRTAFESSNIRFADLLTSIAGDGRPVGVHVLLSADRFNAIPMSLASHLQRRVVFRLADSSDYSTLGVPDDVLTSASPPGRGLLDEHEIQVATLGGTSDLMLQAQEVREYGKAQRAGGVGQAPAIERLPERILLSELPMIVEGAPVIGKLGSSLAPARIDPKGIFMVTGPRGSGRSTALRTIVGTVHAWHPDLSMFYIGGRKSDLSEADYWTKAGTTDEAIRETIEALTAIQPEGLSIVLVIEGVEQLASSPIDAALRECIGRLLDTGQFVVAEGDISTMSQMRELPMLLRSSRTGIALMPDPNANLSGIFGADFPRFKRSDFCEGRGFLVQRGRTPDIVQVAIS